MGKPEGLMSRVSQRARQDILSSPARFKEVLGLTWHGQWMIPLVWRTDRWLSFILTIAVLFGSAVPVLLTVNVGLLVDALDRLQTVVEVSKRRWCGWRWPWA